MNDIGMNLILEMGLFTFLGVLYYFYQKRKIIKYEENKTPVVMGMILQSCLTEKKEESEPELDALIEALDDYLQNKSATPPTALLKIFAGSSKCSKELAEVISAGLLELEDNGKE